MYFRHLLTPSIPQSCEEEAKESGCRCPDRMGCQVMMGEWVRVQCNQVLSVLCCNTVSETSRQKTGSSVSTRLFLLSVGGAHSLAPADARARSYGAISLVHFIPTLANQLQSDKLSPHSPTLSLEQTMRAAVLCLLLGASMLALANRVPLSRKPLTRESIRNHREYVKAKYVCMSEIAHHQCSHSH